MQFVKVRWDDIRAGYPELTKEDIHAALEYARASLDHAEIESLAAQDA